MSASFMDGHDQSWGHILKKVVPFVGRKPQLDWFETCIQQVRAGHPRVALIAGEAGIGKTRLLKELPSVAQRYSLQVCYGRCYETLALPYLPFIEALRTALESLPEETLHTLRLDIEIMTQFIQDGGMVLPAFTVSTSPHTDQDKLRWFLSVSRAVIKLAQHRPFLCIVDDLHWADGPSLDLFGYLAFSLATTAPQERVPCLLVGTYRSLDVSERLTRLLTRLQREEICQILDLPGLDEAETFQLLQTMGLARPSHQLLTMLREVTRGNPLFVQETVHHIVQQDYLEEREGYVTTTATGADLQLPVHMADTITARIQRLSVDCQRTLEWAAVLGDPFSLQVLSAVIDKDEETLLEFLEVGMHQHLLQSAGQNFLFVHPLMQHALYSQLSVPRRQRCHCHIAQALESLYADHLEEHTLEIAYHLIRAGPVAALDKVVTYARQAGDQACRAFAWGEAARYYEVPLAADLLSMQERAELHYQAGLAYHRDQDMGPCLDHYKKAIELYRTVGDVRGLAHTLMRQTELQYSLTALPLGSLPDLQPLEEALEALGDSDPGLRGRILDIMALAYRNARQTATALRMATQALEIGRQFEDDELCARASNSLAQTQIHNLYVRESLESYQGAVAFARRIGDPWLQGLPLQRSPLGFIMLGQLDTAEKVALEACELARATQDWGNYSLPLAHLTYSHVARGAWQAAQHYAQEAQLMIARSGHPWGATRTLYALACMHTLRSAWAEAEHILDMLIEPGRVFKDVGPMIRIPVEVFRRLTQAYAGRVDGDMESLVTAFQKVVDTDTYSLAPYCALIELSDLMTTPDMAERPFQVLARVAERGVLFTPEWLFLVPRVLGVAAMLHEAWDKAEAYFQDAIAAATGAGAQPELGRSYLDYARMLVARNQADDWHHAHKLLAQAEPLCHALGMQPFVQRAVQLTAVLHTSPLTRPQPDVSSPEELSQREAAVLLRRALDSTRFL
jgi:tetratricopeptide (TPR) repeat protein